ncbi:MAG: amidohydrolase [Chitinophagaceae bacterium]|nr:amidohydrolase [Chitinophagaceae bacterium]
MLNQVQGLKIWRRDFHQFPELSNREFNTSKKVAQHLKSLGLEVKEGIAKTGVVGILKGAKPGPVIALRADMDALPVVERNSLPYKSTVVTEYGNQKVGVMHACGHDAHTAILMGAAEVLSKLKAELAGTVVFIFQPAEEGAPEGEEGGAALMMKEGVLDNPKVDVIFGLHIESNIPAGDIQYKVGSFMASADLFKVKVKGKSSHGSQPWLGVDPIYVSAQIINAFQSIVSRSSDLTQAPVVITVGAIHSGVRFNIIPEEAELLGTIRNLDKDIRVKVLEEVKSVAQSIASTHHAVAEVTIENKTLVTYNTPDLVQKMLPTLEKAAGKNNVRSMNWVTGAEDFSFFGEKVPSFFFYFGGMPRDKNPKDAPPHHTPDFMIDDSKLDVGVKAFCMLVFDYAAMK